MITGPVSWYWESERGRCREDVPDSFQSIAHPQGVWTPGCARPKFAGLVAAGLGLHINTDTKKNTKGIHVLPGIVWHLWTVFTYFYHQLWASG